MSSIACKGLYYSRKTYDVCIQDRITLTININLISGASRVHGKKMRRDYITNAQGIAQTKMSYLHRSVVNAQVLDACSVGL